MFGSCHNPILICAPPLKLPSSAKMCRWRFTLRRMKEKYVPHLHHFQMTWYSCSYWLPNSYFSHSHPFTQQLGLATGLATPKNELSGIRTVFHMEKESALLLQKNTLVKMSIWRKHSVLDYQQKTQLTWPGSSAYRALILCVFIAENQRETQLTVPSQIPCVETANLAWMAGSCLSQVNRKHVPGSASGSLFI